jgi:acetyl-CoA carboxylase carboxyl transferase subunit beta
VVEQAAVNRPVAGSSPARGAQWENFFYMSWYTNIRPRLRSLVMKSEVPDHLWTKCPKCSQMLYTSDLQENLFVCKHCQYHIVWKASDRLSHLFDSGRYESLHLPAVKLDPLSFKDQKRYIDRLKEAKQKTGQSEAIILASGMVNSVPVVAGCFQFDFIGGSMGMAVGEAIVEGAKQAVHRNAAYLLIPSSGGARMQEGILSLMQMPRSVVASSMVKEAGLPFVTLLTHPTTGGVSASFASLGDLVLAEPGAIIGFTGARVISEILKQPLPDGFQTSEFQRDHGFVDLIVERKDIPTTLGQILSMLRKKV